METVKFDEVFERVKLITGWKTQQALADFLKIASASVSGTKKQNTFPLRWAKCIADHYKVSINTILYGIDSPPIPKDELLFRQPQSYNVDQDDNLTIPEWTIPDPEMFDFIPMADAQLSDEGESFAISQKTEGYYAFRKSWLNIIASSPRNLVLMRVCGDSMSPTIQRGDTVMIDTGCRSVRDGIVYAIRLNSIIMIKRLSVRPKGCIIVISDNCKVSDSFEVDVSELYIIGRVSWIGRKM